MFENSGDLNSDTLCASESVHYHAIRGEMMSASKPSSEFRGRDELLNEEEEELIVTHERKEDEEEESDDDRETMKWC